MNYFSNDSFLTIYHDNHRQCETPNLLDRSVHEFTDTPIARKPTTV